MCLSRATGRRLEASSTAKSNKKIGIMLVIGFVI
jgi:hypothetical protein